MIRLILKELKQLLPFALLYLALVALFYGSELSTLRIDEESYASWCGELCQYGTNVDMVLFIVLLYMIAAYSLFPREFDDSTIDFLRSLPIARQKIFFSKVLGAWILLCLLLIFDRSLTAAVLSFNSQTITGKFYWNNEALFLLRDCLFALVIVSHGVFLSWFRTVGLIIYSVYLVALIWLEQMLGAAGIYNIFSFYSNEYDGPNLLVDWTVIGFHLAVAFVLLIISYFLWTRSDSKPKAPGSGKLAKVMPVLLSVVAFVMAAAFMFNMLLEVAVDQANVEIEQLSTEHYDFTYRSPMQGAMEKLEPFVEDDYQQLVELLGAQNAPVISADMTSDSEHALGLAAWKKIRMVLLSEDEVDPLYRRVLSHETAHVFQAVESDRALSNAGNSVGFFIEGMAQYTSFNIVPDPEARESNWLVSAESWKRHTIRFEHMANRTVFEGLYDPEMLYGIGDIWVDAMARACGQASIGDFLRAVGRDDAPPNLSGVTYWRNHLQYIGCELEEVNNQWRKLMQEIADNRTIGAFPLFENVNVTRDPKTDLITIKADLKEDEVGGLPQFFYVRVKSEAKLASTVSPVLNGRLSVEGDKASVEFSVLPRLIEGNRFSYQLGYSPLPDSRSFFDRWRSGSVPD